MPAITSSEPTRAPGSGYGAGGDGGQALAATFSFPTGVAVDSTGNWYIADTGNHQVRKITPNGIISTFAGNGNSRDSSDEGNPATDVLLRLPAGVWVDATGNVFIADTFNHRVVVVAAVNDSRAVLIRCLTPINEIVENVKPSSAIGAPRGQARHRPRPSPPHPTALPSARKPRAAGIFRPLVWIKVVTANNRVPRAAQGGRNVMNLLQQLFLRSAAPTSDLA